MKIAVYSPYLDTAGGGEKYMLSLAEVLSEDNEVDILLDNHIASLDLEQIKEKIVKFHGINFSKINFIKAPFGKGSFFARLFFLRKYDWLFYLTDGSIFLSTAKKSIIHFQVPFENINKSSLWDKIKLKSWNKAIYNSIFTKEIVEESWDINGEVVYPPVSVEAFKPLDKQKQIVSVGRFFSFTKDKKQEVMIDAFKSMVDKFNVKDWSLHLAGGADQGNLQYVEELRERAKGFNIFIHPNISFVDLKNLYGESSIYWHATGFGETDPKRYEHFGITTVEAMASGCVPVVIGLGGQVEIVENTVSGYLWNSIEEFTSTTLKLIKEPQLLSMVSKKAVERATLFNKSNFDKKIKDLVRK